MPVMTPEMVALCLAIGVGGGLIGGFLGIGGSLVLIPALALTFGPENQHLYQAVAMVVNLFVALAAVIRHMRAGAVRRDALKGMIPAALVFIIIGVLVSNQLNGKALARVFAAFLVYVILVNIRRLILRLRLNHAAKRAAAADAEGATAKDRDHPAEGERMTPAPASIHEDPDRPVPLVKSLPVGAVMGGFAGLLGIGGGGIAVPLQQIVYRIPLKQCIGTSTAVICITSGVGAVVKNLTLSHAPGPVTYTIAQSMALASALIPGAMIGSFLGATLTHRLSTTWLRLVFIILMSMAAVEMSGLWGD